ncbi:MAG: hypothetical protein Q8P64_15075 [Deltaproteobacteria bacterium]|nr:hypothetical protein [Deltaproteobacteria bacterium]
MKSIWIILIFSLTYSIAMAGPTTFSSKGLASRIYVFEGKLFTGLQDPDYKDYDLALRNHLVRRIHKRFGIELDPRTYSGFDLLEIESLIRFKKSNEPLDPFLRMFPKTP